MIAIERETPAILFALLAVCSFERIVSINCVTSWAESRAVRTNDIVDAFRTGMETHVISDTSPSDTSPSDSAITKRIRLGRSILAFSVRDHH